MTESLMQVHMLDSIVISYLIHCLYLALSKQSAAREVMEKLPPDSIALVQRSWKMQVRVVVCFHREHFKHQNYSLKATVLLFYNYVLLKYSCRVLIS